MSVVEARIQIICYINKKMSFSNCISIMMKSMYLYEDFLKCLLASYKGWRRNLFHLSSIIFMYAFEDLGVTSFITFFIKRIASYKKPMVGFLLPFTKQRTIETNFMMFTTILASFQNDVLLPIALFSYQLDYHSRGIGTTWELNIYFNPFLLLSIL